MDWHLVQSSERLWLQVSKNLYHVIPCTCVGMKLFSIKLTLSLFVLVFPSAIYQARVIKDKKPLVEDINLMDTKLYKHREEVRGRSDFSVDNEHGGYKLERSQ